MSKPAYIASDVHLGAVPRDTEFAFVQFLDRVGERASRLILAGDLFDFWFEYGSVIPGEHFRVLAALARLVEAGIPVAMVGGNHDAWGGRFLREEVGIDFHAGALRTVLAGGPALVVHGDGVGRGDLGYRMLKAVLRSRAAIAGFRALHPELGIRIARRVSTTEGKAETDAAARGRARYIEEWAGERFASEPDLRWIVCGHSHLPAIREFGAGQHYLNAGDWIRHRTYIVVEATGAAKLHAWPDG